MSYLDNVEGLKRFLKVKEDKKGVTHYINNKSSFLPFTTTEPERVKFNNGFNGVMGELSRAITNKELKEEIDLREFVEEIGENIEIEEEDKGYFYKLLHRYLINENNNIKVIHPYLFRYLNKLPTKEGKGEREIGLFIRDILFKEYREFDEYFEEKNASDVMTKLILTNLKPLEEFPKDNKYNNLLEFPCDTLKKDLEFLRKHEEFLMKNLSIIIAYYYFYYVSQLTIKLNKGSKANLQSVEEVYYLLDWETTSKNRASITKGYNYIKEEGKELYLNINVLEHLNHIFGTEGKEFTLLKGKYVGLTDGEKSDLLEAIQLWISIYREKMEFIPYEDLPSDYDKLVECLKESLNEGLSKATRSRYYLSLESIGRKYFMKKRGSYGYMLNIDQELLLIITAMCIKEDKITLKSLFKEYEKRGIFFDRYSTEEIVNLLDKLNLIDKKSDSGDGQYVKSIL